jgi:deoxyuridine 5'-triphosphate nucleotidohydrolase
MILKCKKLHEDAVIPMRGTPDSAGLDLSSLYCGVIPSGKHKLFKTGIAVEIPTGYEGVVRGRSGNALKYGVVSHIGTIDADYRGDVGVILFNFGDEDYFVSKGDRIAQLVISPIVMPTIEMVEELDCKTRTGGFGSTGGTTTYEEVWLERQIESATKKRPI